MFWTAVGMAVLAFAAMAALFSMRYDRNLFAEAWTGFKRHTVAPALEQASAVAQPAKTEISRCTIDGRIVYSNVECGKDNPTSRKVQLNDTRGIEPPKVPPPEASADEATPVVLDKMIEKAISRPTGASARDQ